MKANEILFIREHTKNDTTYSVFVVNKSRRVSDNREYLTDSLESLPKYIKTFIDNHTCELERVDELNGDTFAQYIYK